MGNSIDRFQVELKQSSLEGYLLSPIPGAPAPLQPYRKHFTHPKSNNSLHPTAPIHPSPRVPFLSFPFRAWLLQGGSRSFYHHPSSLQCCCLSASPSVLYLSPSVSVHAYLCLSVWSHSFPSFLVGSGSQVGGSGLASFLDSYTESLTVVPVPNERVQRW